VRVAAGHHADHIVVRASSKRERCELHVEAEGGELARDIIAGRAVALRSRDGVAHPLQREHVTPQPFGESRPLTEG
jgi:hypothetical protein